MSAARHEPGLAYLRRIIAGELPGIPIGDTLGFRLAEAEVGRVVITGRPGRESYNLIGTVHGGWAAAVLDSAMALACLSALEAEQSFTTVDIRINYLRPLTVESGEVRAEGRVLQAGRRLAYCEARLEDASGKLLAHGTGSCLVFARS